ncbi:hypothetical protein HDU81_008867 [Chytriomyces hyalinus]|nr:hypothetical protein HDU81_008867 [Chytriomyces hyalinus]
MKKGRFDDRLQKRLRGLKTYVVVNNSRTANVKPREFSLKSRLKLKESTSSAEQTKSETKELTNTLVRSVPISPSKNAPDSNASTALVPSTKPETAAATTPASHPALQPIRRSKRKKKFDSFELTNKENKDTVSNTISTDVVAPDNSNDNNDKGDASLFKKKKKGGTRTKVVTVTGSDSLNDADLVVAPSRVSEVVQESGTKVSRVYGKTLSLACGDYKVAAISVDEFVGKMRVAVESGALDELTQRILDSLFQ